MAYYVRKIARSKWQENQPGAGHNDRYYPGK